jgi:hypothetical protein
MSDITKKMASPQDGKFGRQDNEGFGSTRQAGKQSEIVAHSVDAVQRLRNEGMSIPTHVH